jgi:hypothetical protein|tara:strand:+ start:197 stop:781 length:585 start_codon:yes stop_codon:yes gene_type:complete
MPLVFRKVYGDVGGKRQVIRTEKISGDAAREYVANREAARAKAKEERTFANLLKKLFVSKAVNKIEEKAKVFTESVGGTYNEQTRESIIPLNFNQQLTKSQIKKLQADSDKRRAEETQTSRFNVDLGMPNLDLRRRIEERKRRNLVRDQALASGARLDLGSMGLMGEGTNINNKVDQTLGNAFGSGGIFNFRLF